MGDVTTRKWNRGKNTFAAVGMERNLNSWLSSSVGKSRIINARGRDYEFGNEDKKKSDQSRKHHRLKGQKLLLGNVTIKKET